MRFLTKVLALIIFGGFLNVAEANGSTSAQVIVEVQTNSLVSVDKMEEELSKKDVIFFGEFHDQKVLHEMETALLELLYLRHGDKLVLSLEMFEADNQERLDKYLSNQITEADFLKESRPWPNYTSDYRPLVEFAKAHGIPVLAANVPRHLASHLAKNGSLDSVEVEQRQYLPKFTSAPEGKYKTKFFNFMGGTNSEMKMPPERLKTVFAAQCLKDDKMAESIINYLNANPGKIVYHVNGSFHSDAHLGTVERVEQRNAELKVGVISPKFLTDNSDYLINYAEDKKDGEYIVYIPRESK